MIKSLRKRPRPDALKTEQRRMTNRTGRIVYLGLLLAMLVGGINFLFGDLVFLRADGLVLKNRTTISTTYVASVESVEVKPGDVIQAGAPLLRLQSTDILERLADLSSKEAALTAKAAEFKIRSATVSNLLPLAKKREHETARMLKKMEQLSEIKVATLARYDTALRARFDAQQSFIEMETQNGALKWELAAIDAARADAKAAQVKLRDHYADGIVKAPEGGAIGTSVPSRGDVYKPGDRILEIYSGKAYVLAFLPRRYVFPLDVGTKVHINGGRLSAVGVIADILPVTDALPKEFQNSFKPRDRSQLARIRLDQAPPFPLHAKVTVTLAGDLF